MEVDLIMFFWSQTDNVGSTITVLKKKLGISCWICWVLHKLKHEWKGLIVFKLLFIASHRSGEWCSAFAISETNIWLCLFPPIDSENLLMSVLCNLSTPSYNLTQSSALSTHIILSCFWRISARKIKYRDYHYDDAQIREMCMILTPRNSFWWFVWNRMSLHTQTHTHTYICTYLDVHNRTIDKYVSRNDHDRQTLTEFI